MKIVFSADVYIIFYSENCFAFDLMTYKPNNEILNKYADYLLDTTSKTKT